MVSHMPSFAERVWCSFLSSGFLFNTICTQMKWLFHKSFLLLHLPWNIAFWLLIGKSWWCFFLFYLGFLSRTVTNHLTVEEGEDHLFRSSLQCPPVSQTYRQPDDYCRELISAHSLWPDSNLEPFFSERKSLTT